MRSVLLGIFVGGAGTRMGGVAKGLLEHDGESLVARWLRIAAACAVPARLVGRHPAYAQLGTLLDDAAPATGPLGGLTALLRHADTRYVVAVACDMPFVSQALLERLLDAPPAAVVAARRSHWEPLFARYEVATLRPVAERLLASGRYALRPLLEGAVPLALTATEAAQLRDWDTPSDRLTDS